MSRQDGWKGAWGLDYKDLYLTKDLKLEGTILKGGRTYIVWRRDHIAHFLKLEMNKETGEYNTLFIPSKYIKYYFRNVKEPVVQRVV